jgi:hypothetical protein
MLTYLHSHARTHTQVLGLYLLQQHGCIETLGLNQKKLCMFLAQIEGGMQQSNPYHNAIHVANVVQFMHVLISTYGLRQYMTPLQVSTSPCKCSRICFKQVHQ